jgi:hypothetical protein
MRDDLDAGSLMTKLYRSDQIEAHKDAVSRPAKPMAEPLVRRKASGKIRL